MFKDEIYPLSLRVHRYMYQVNAFMCSQNKSYCSTNCLRMIIYYEGGGGGGGGGGGAG